MILLFYSLLAFSNVYSDTNVIYGRDNRKDLYLVSDPITVRLAKSTAALIKNTHLQNRGNVIAILGPSLKEAHSLCEDQRYLNQPSASHCSGTLIAPDIIMTAAHCYSGEDLCQNDSWVFDYEVRSENQASVIVPTSSVYRCQKILLSDHRYGNREALADQALIKLDRPVTNRRPIPISRLPVRLGEELVMIGHPWGLPKKVTDGGWVMSIKQYSYLTNLDAFSGNSGSGVFNSRTGEVVGILSGGANDKLQRNGCYVVNVLKMEQGEEKVMKLDPIRAYFGL